MLDQPNEIVIVDHRRTSTIVLRYDFETDGKSTAGMPRDVDQRAFETSDTVPQGMRSRAGPICR